MAAWQALGNVLAMDGGNDVAGCSVFVLGIGKSSLSPPPTQHELIAGVVGAQLCRRLDQQPEDHGAIIIGQFYQAGLGDKPAQLN